MEPAVERAEAIWRQVQAIGYPPLQAESLLQLDRAQALAYQPEVARSSLVRAASEAVTANDDALTAEAWLPNTPLVMERVGRV